MLKEKGKVSTDEFKVAMLTGTGVELLRIIIDLVVDYEKRGIEEIPVSTIKDAIGEASMRNLTHGFLNHMMSENEVED